MTIERLVYDKEELSRFGFRAVSVLVFGETSLLLKLNSDGIFAVEPIEPSDRAYFEKETKNLTPANQIYIPGINAYQIDYLQQERDSSLRVKWAERTTGVDEPTLEIPTEDVVNYERSGLKISEQELMELFGISNASATRKATFFTLDTSENEAAGIVLKRTTPVLFFVRPQMELGKLSTLTGLNSFLNNIYTELTQKATDVQKQVDRAVFEASLPSNGKLEFVLSGSKKKLAEVHQKIYQIQCLLTALHADPKLGTQDPKLLAIAPFLKTENGGLKLFRPQAPKPVQIDNSIWEKLIEKPKAGFIATSSARVISRPQRVVKASTSPAHPVTRVEAPTPTKSEKDKALELATVLVRGMESTASYLKDTNLDDFNLKKIKELESKTANLAQLAGKYLETRKRGKSPLNPTATKIGTVFVGHGFSAIKTAEIYNFLTKEGVAVDFRVKVDEAIEKVQKQIIPLFRETPSRQERSLVSLKTNRRLLRDEQLSLNSTISAVEKLVQSNNVQGEIYVGELGLGVLISQINYVLLERIQELKSAGEAVEIDNWVNYCYATFDRLSRLISECYTK